MKFFNLDLHASVITDIERIFSSMGHGVDSINMSGHNWVFGRRQGTTEVVTAENWRQLGPAMCDAFYARYKGELEQYDAFIVTHTPSFALLFEKWGKPVIVVASTRYEAPFSDNPGRWAWLNDKLRAGVDAGRFHLVANNRYDAAYGEHFLGRKFLHIPSLCEYTGVSYGPEKGTFAHYSRFDGHSHFSGGEPLPLENPFRTRHGWRDITRYRGIVAVPHNISTMSLFEFYAQGMPMFIPTPRLMLAMRREFPNGILEEMSWNQVFKLPSRSAIPGATDADDPNDYADLGKVAHWLTLADFYDVEWMPYLRYFDSWAELREILSAIGNDALRETSERMAAFQRVRRERVHRLWRQVIERVAP